MGLGTATIGRTGGVTAVQSPVLSNLGSSLTTRPILSGLGTQFGGILKTGAGQLVNPPACSTQPTPRTIFSNPPPGDPSLHECRRDQEFPHHGIDQNIRAYQIYQTGPRLGTETRSWC